MGRRREAAPHLLLVTTKIAIFVLRMQVDRESVHGIGDLGDGRKHHGQGDHGLRGGVGRRLHR